MARPRFDHPIERDDRGRQDSADAAIRQLADVAERRVVQLGGLEHVTDRDRSALAGRESEATGEKPARVAEADPACPPLCNDGRRLAGLAEADEAALDVRRPRRLLDRDLEELVEIAPRADGERDPRDQTLALERVRERTRRTRPLEGQTRLGRERLHQRELVQVEKTRAPDGRKDDADHLAASPHRNEGTALDRRELVQASVHDRRALGVVHREGGALPHDGADAGRLLVERDRLADQPLVVLAAVPRRDEAGSPAVVLDEREVRDIELEELRQLVQQHTRDPTPTSVSSSRCER